MIELTLKGQSHCAQSNPPEPSNESILSPSTETSRSRLSPSNAQQTTIPGGITGLAPTAELDTLLPTPRDEIKLVDKGKGRDAERGRTLRRCPRFGNPLAKAESRDRRSDAAIEVDARPLGKRLRRSSTFHDDPSDHCAILDDNLLEPCPHLPICPPVSEVLDTIATAPSLDSCQTSAETSIKSSQSVELPAAALTTVFSDCQPLYPAPTFSPDRLQQVNPDISHLEYLAVKSSSPILAVPPNAAPEDSCAAPSIAHELPTEIMHAIYYNLGPLDFNSARRTCRSWFITSLDKPLLETMLRRGGYSSSVRRDMTANHVLGSEIRANDEWLLSKRLARECALGPDWTGNGLSAEDDGSDRWGNSAFLHISTIDFTEVAVHCPTTNTTSTVFTVSCCGRFVMAANGCLVYLYELNRHHAATAHSLDIQPGSLRPVTSIICPGRVLACSMDTSTHRYAIAILLDGRMGLVCDITALNQSTQISRNPHDSSKSSRQSPITTNTLAHVSDADGFRGTSFLDRVSLNSSGSNLASAQAPNDPPFVFPGIATTGTTIAPVEKSAWQDVFWGDMPESTRTASTRTAGPSSRHSSLPRVNPLKSDGRVQSVLPPHQDTDHGSRSMPIETGPRSLYRNLCSDDDPPRSVAICPQRRCVAFGCSSGIELHWVDALTGQDLNRWFPLTAPSDFLFFLPPRRSVDSAKKLRLISSAAGPSERPAIGERAFGERLRSSPFWGRLGRTSDTREEGDNAPGRVDLLTRIRGGNSLSRSYSGRFDYSDHYRAVPLSDGYHILFTDPATGLLCMGSDAPVGGPTKLLRKIWFDGPEGQCSPSVYAGGSDLSWGVRVVAAFGSGTEQSIWLFSVPNDIFAAEQTPHQSRNLSGGPTWPKTPGRTCKNMEWLDWWPGDGMQEFLDRNQDPIPGIHPHSVWPVKIKGQEIGKCQGVVDLAIDSGAHMIVWAFSKQGVAKVWKINDGQRDSVRSLSVVRDGTVRDNDGDGDIEMIDVRSLVSSSTESLPLEQESFDGSASFTSAMHMTRAARRYKAEWDGHNVHYDSDGDVLMEDVSLSEDPSDVESQTSFDHVTSFGFRGEVQYASRAWSRETSSGVNLIEELTGITRIDIEIR